MAPDPGDLRDTSSIWKHNIDVVGISDPGYLTLKTTQAETTSGVHQLKTKAFVGSAVAHASSVSITAIYYDPMALLSL